MSSGNRPLIETLQRLSAAQATGTLFLSLPDKRQARIGLLHGQIMHLALFTLRGELVIRALSNRPPLSFSFQPGAVPDRQGGLPETSLLLQQLAAGHREQAPAAAEALPPLPPTLPDSVLQVVTQELARFVGPMASILVDEQAASVSVEALLTKL
ncbi:MAG: hypothetical protein JWR16_1477, partial [Nevskia sp.]|nr:hypothetical protein [Nevskia sp.]